MARADRTRRSGGVKHVDEKGDRRSLARERCRPAASVWAFNTSFLRDAPLAYFTDTDWGMFRETLYKALNENADGVAAQWNNRSSGSSGEVTP